jgi:hypothetical protein
MRGINVETFRVSNGENFYLTRTRISIHDRTTEYCCLPWEGYMFAVRNDRVASLVMRNGYLKMLFLRNSSWSVQLKTSHRWKRKKDRERTNRQNEIFTHTICKTNTTAQNIAYFSFLFTSLTSESKFQVSFFPRVHQMYSAYIFLMATK